MRRPWIDCALATLALLSSGTVCAKGDPWYFLQRESGCLSFASAPAKGYSWLAVPSDVRTPEQVLAYMKRTRIPDAAMTPLLDYAPARKPWETPGEDKSPMSRSNAFVIHPRDNSGQIIVLSRELCAQMGYSVD